MSDFRPSRLLRPTLIQTGLAALGPGTKRYAQALAPSETQVIPCSDDIRLSAKILTPDAPKGQAILIHGWEGSADSSYVTRMGGVLLDAGYRIARLNLRDHGGTHALNDTPFFATNLQEVCDAVDILCGQVPELPTSVIGFSLGGNFALRIGAHFGSDGPKNLAHLFPISPAIIPATSTQAIADSPVIERYFLKKWRRSLTLKQAAFPDLYDFSDVIAQPGIWEMTRKVMKDYSPYPRAEDYFAAYQIYPAHFEKIALPTHILASRDDPVTPTQDLIELGETEVITQIITEHGGHNGFFASFSGKTYYEDVILSTLGITQN